MFRQGREMHEAPGKFFEQAIMQKQQNQLSLFFLFTPLLGGRGGSELITGGLAGAKRVGSQITYNAASRETNY